MHLKILKKHKCFPRVGQTVRLAGVPCSVRRQGTLGRIRPAAVRLFTSTKHITHNTMSAAAAAPKTKKAPAKPKAPAAHPPYAAMVKAAVKALADKKGSSRQAILKYIVANYKVGDAARAGKLLNAALKKAVAGGALKMAAAAGKKNSGCYKVAEKVIIQYLFHLFLE